MKKDEENYTHYSAFPSYLEKHNNYRKLEKYQRAYDVGVSNMLKRCIYVYLGIELVGVWVIELTLPKKSRKLFSDSYVEYCLYSKHDMWIITAIIVILSLQLLSSF